MEDADTVLSDLVAITQFMIEKDNAGSRIESKDAVYMAELFQNLDEIMRTGDQLPEVWDV